MKKRYCLRRAEKEARPLVALAKKLTGQKPEHKYWWQSGVKHRGYELYKMRLYNVALREIKGELPRRT